MARSIRLADSDDRTAIERCVERAYSPYVERMGKLAAPMLADYKDLIAQQRAHLAVDDDCVIGVIVMWAVDDHWYVDNVAADPDQLGSGVGTMLLDHAATTAKQAGYREVRLYTNVTMIENLAYYPRRGFVETHRAFDAGYERVYFSRVLPEAQP